MPWVGISQQAPGKVEAGKLEAVDPCPGFLQGRGTTALWGGRSISVPLGTRVIPPGLLHRRGLRHGRSICVL